MKSLALDDIDRILEAALLLRDSEVMLLRNLPETSAMAWQDEKSRLDAFCCGVLEGLADRVTGYFEPLALLTYLYAVASHGPGEKTRAAVDYLFSLGKSPLFDSYIACGNEQVQAILSGARPSAGLVAGLVLEELGQTGPERSGN